MMKVIQKRIVKVIQPRIVEYYCDECGDRCGTRDNPKEVWYNRGGQTHYCKRKRCFEKKKLFNRD